MHRLRLTSTNSSLRTATTLAIALAAEKVLGSARQRLGVPPLGV